MTLGNLCHKIFDNLAAFPFRAIHIFRIAGYQLVHFILRNQFVQPVEVSVKLTTADGFHALSREPQ